VASKPKPVGDSGAASPAAGRWLFPVAFASQTLGAAIIIAIGVPIYRQLLATPESYDPTTATTLWALAAIALIQAGYWPLFHAPAREPRLSNAVLGHVVQFIARLLFMVVTAVFSFAFIQKRIDEIPLDRVALILALLFSLFCYMLEVQRLGSAIIGPRR
jgi:hypothetical protein